MIRSAPAGCEGVLSVRLTRVWRRCGTGLLFASALGCGHASAGADPWDASEAENAKPSGLTQVLGVRFGGDQMATRMVFDLSGPVLSRLSPSSEDGQAVLILSSLIAADPGAGSGRGAVRAWRLLRDEAGSRLVLDLADNATVSRHFLLPPAADGRSFRLVVDVSRGESAIGHSTATMSLPPATTVANATASTAMSASAASRSRSFTTPVTHRRAGRSVKVIVVDAGHGGHDPGAQSQNHDEKDITLAAALTLKRRLEQSGRYRVVLTRGGDVFIPLDERVRIARKAGADLFISLHADSAGAEPGTHGASIYTLSDHGETRVHTVLGQNEWFDRAGKRSDPAVGQILLDLTQNNTRNRSSTFAGLLLQHLSDRVDLLPRTHRDAGYFVLLAPDVPAVLLEMGFISNPDDEARLSDPAQRRRLMDGVAEAIDGYFVAPTQVASQADVGTP